MSRAGNYNVLSMELEKEKYVNLGCVQFKPSSGRESKVEGKAQTKSSIKCFWPGKCFRILKIISVHRTHLLLYIEQAENGSAFKGCPYQASDFADGTS
jgi:hypothetical protein